ncbi:hypothetical protein [Hymenobacter seoulensis]
MKRLLTERFAARALLCIIALTLGFHALVMSGVIPYEIVWGGRLHNQNQMLTFELVSIAINLLMLGVVAARAGLLKAVPVPPVVLTGVLWLMVALFVLNTLGNLASESTVEKVIFTPVTLALAVCSLRLALGKSRAPHQARV